MLSWNALKWDIEESEWDSGTSVGKMGHVPPKLGWLTPMHLVPQLSITARH